MGTLALEFTRLSQLTNNPKYHSAVQTVMDELYKLQSSSNVPGLWPTIVDATGTNETMHVGSPSWATSETYSLGALADSAYEYIAKEYLILGGLEPGYREMYERFSDAANRTLLFRPLNLAENDILMAGIARASKDEETTLEPSVEHLNCFAGGMFAIGGRVFQRPQDVEIGRRLTDGCIWAYRSTLSGMMPETIHVAPCANRITCPWNSTRWLDAVDHDQTRALQLVRAGNFPAGFTKVVDDRFLLR
jgi:mannosyl-oligosaccharide alpha-1,2-mannosidase